VELKRQELGETLRTREAVLREELENLASLKADAAHQNKTQLALIKI